MKRYFQSGIYIASILALALLSQGTALGQQLTEDQVKAGFLFNFTKFVDWPQGLFAASNSPITICVLDNEAFETILEETVRGKLSNGRPVLVNQMQGTKGDFGQCHILYFTDPSAKANKELVAKLRNSNILTVGNTADFCDTGGIVSFLSERSRVRFEINPDAARMANLHISSRMLSLAIVSAGRARSSAQ